VGVASKDGLVISFWSELRASKAYDFPAIVISPTADSGLASVFAE
jgi:hypothetical protein